MADGARVWTHGAREQAHRSSRASSVLAMPKRFLMLTRSRFVTIQNGVHLERWRIFDTSTGHYVVGPSGRTRWFASAETADAAIKRLASGPARQSARVRSFRRFGT